MNEDLEIWKDIEGYNGKYQVSTAGRIRRVYPSGHIRIMRTFPKSGKNVRSKSRPFVHLTDNKGKDKQYLVTRLVVNAFLKQPPGTIAYHKNGSVIDNWVGNIGFATRQEIGRKYGYRSKSKPVVKIDRSGEIVAVYRSAREAGRQNYISYQSIIDHCNGQYNRSGKIQKIKSIFAPDGYAYSWDDERMIPHVIERVRKEAKHDDR